MITPSVLQNLSSFCKKSLTNIPLSSVLWNNILLHHRWHLDELLRAAEFIKLLHVQVGISFSILIKSLMSNIAFKKILRRFKISVSSKGWSISLNKLDFHLVLSKGNKFWPQNADRLGRNASSNFEVVSWIVHYK